MGRDLYGKWALREGRGGRRRQKLGEGDVQKAIKKTGHIRGDGKWAF